MLLTYQECLDKYGSDYQIKKEIGILFRQNSITGKEQENQYLNPLLFFFGDYPRLERGQIGSSMMLRRIWRKSRSLLTRNRLHW